MAGNTFRLLQYCCISHRVVTYRREEKQLEKYQNLTDEELIEQLRIGDEKIMDFILDKYKPLVRKKTNAMYLIGGDTDDLIQEGMIGLFKAIRDYNSEKESSFFHFADLCISRQLYTAVEASNRKKHAPLNSYISLYSGTNEDGVVLADALIATVADNPEQMMIDQENMVLFLDRIKGRLSKMECQVLDYYLSGLNYQQIAEEMKKSPKAIDNALQRIKTKIRSV
ncbi:MAG: RNA polymerase sporulation sigma factor SigH [Roseburia sp.]|nr:RNA polymerase sporulation sigma factor SigH [Roseburia sp.]